MALKKLGVEAAVALSIIGSACGASQKPKSSAQYLGRVRAHATLIDRTDVTEAITQKGMSQPEMKQLKLETIFAGILEPPLDFCASLVVDKGKSVESGKPVVIAFGGEQQQSDFSWKAVPKAIGEVSLVNAGNASIDMPTITDLHNAGMTEPRVIDLGTTLNKDKSRETHSFSVQDQDNYGSNYIGASIVAITQAAGEHLGTSQKPQVSLTNVACVIG